MPNDKNDNKKPSPIKLSFRKRRKQPVVVMAGEESDVTDDESYLPTSLRFDPNDANAPPKSSSIMASYADSDSDEDTITAPEYRYTFDPTNPGSGASSVDEDEGKEEGEDYDDEMKHEKGEDEDEDGSNFLSRVAVVESNGDDHGEDVSTELSLVDSSDGGGGGEDAMTSTSSSITSLTTGPVHSDLVTSTNIQNDDTKVKNGEPSLDAGSSYNNNKAAEKLQQEREEGERSSETKHLPLAQAQSPNADHHQHHQQHSSNGNDDEVKKAQPQSPPIVGEVGITSQNTLDSAMNESLLPSATTTTTTATTTSDNLSTSNKENVEPQSKLATLPPSSTLRNKNQGGGQNNAKNNTSNPTMVGRGILRIGSRDRSMSPGDGSTNARLPRTNSDGSVRKIVSFADENGGTIHKQHTIAVSPNKLTRRVRRNKPPFPSQFNTGDDKMQEGVMGRVLVLLMDPPTKQYELTSLPYPLVSNDNGIVGPTQLSVLLGLVSKSASYEPLREKSYLGFCRPGDGKELSKELTVVDYSIVKDEVLIAIPEGYGAEECLKFSEPILQDKRLVRLLKKLKKHERKAEKKRRMARNSMKIDRNGVGSASGFEGDGLTDMKDGSDDAVGRDWASILAGGMAILFLALFIVGAFNAVQNEKISGADGKKVSSRLAKKESCLGRGVFCKPFGVQSQESEGRSKFRWLQEISEWKLEGDDLMI